MKKIMFVCHGNICRSPMAESVMKMLVAQKGLQRQFFINSSATSSEELGNPIYAPARRKMIEKGVPIIEHYATKLQASDYEKYDLFVGMDNFNVSNMKNIFGGDADGKVVKLLDFTNAKGDVADPWWTGDFEIAYQDIFRGCTALFASLTESELAEQ